MTVDLVLRTCSVLMVLALLHQIFFSRGGSRKHNLVGNMVMVLGVALAITVAIRGARHEVITTAYIFHLILGGLFFAGIFITGFLGRKAYRSGDEKIKSRHRLCAHATGFFLIGTLVIGVVSFLSY